MSYSLINPRIIRIGAGVSRELPHLLGELGLSHPLIITDKYLEQSGQVEILCESLKKNGLKYGVFSDTVPEPTSQSLEGACAFLQQGSYDCVVGFGGGSPIDTAKAVAILAKHGGTARDYMVPHIQDAAGYPIIAIPTTAGTGSEATRFTIITDDVADEKMLCVGMGFLPIAALIDYELTLTMPRRLTADTGIDALTHAIEAYVSKKANPMSDLFALSAMKSIAPNLRRVWNDPSDRAAREAMMIGSTQAGIAFSNSSVALVHGMSRPIGAHFHVAHGLSNALLLPTITAFSIGGNKQRYAECAYKMGLVEDGTDTDKACACLIEELISLNRDLEVPSPADCGIDHAQWLSLLPIMARQALASGSPGNNPVVPTAEQIEELYNRVWAQSL